MMKFIHKILLLILCCGYSFFAAAGKKILLPDAVTILASTSQDDYEKAIAATLVEAIRVEELVIDVDIDVQPEEISYLVGFKKGDLLDASKLAKAVFYLRKKNKFEQIIFQFKRSDDGKSFKVVLKLVGLWTFKRLKLKGMFLGKDMYRQYYLMEPGDPFDKQKHRESLARLKERFKEEGYYAIHLDDSLWYDKKGKTVEVALKIASGPRFSIGEIKSIVMVDHIAPDELAQVKSKIEEHLKKRLLHKSYSKTSTI